MLYVIDDQQTVHAIHRLIDRKDKNAAGYRTLHCGQTGSWRVLKEFPPDGALCEFCALYMLDQVTVNGYHLPTLARLCRALDRPTKDGLAALVWRLSYTITPVSLAADFMRACGYVPFEGFPLTRLKTPNMESVTR